MIEYIHSQQEGMKMLATALLLWWGHYFLRYKLTAPIHRNRFIRNLLFHLKCLRTSESNPKATNESYDAEARARCYSKHMWVCKQMRLYGLFIHGSERSARDVRARLFAIASRYGRQRRITSTFCLYNSQMKTVERFFYRSGLVIKQFFPNLYRFAAGIA